MKKRNVKNEYIDMNENLEAEDIINQYIKDEISEADLDFIAAGRKMGEEVDIIHGLRDIDDKVKNGPTNGLRDIDDKVKNGPTNGLRDIEDKIKIGPED